MEKYYTPKIEELCVGLECEFRPRLRDGLLAYVNNTHKYSETWHQETVGASHGFPDDVLTQKEFEWQFNQFPLSIDNTIDYYLKTGNLRIKCLDQNDIENLGWIEDIVDSNNIHESWFPKHYPQYKTFIFDKYKLMVEIKELNKEYNVTLDKISIYKNKEFCCFSGKIKNKNELKKIMKQLGIQEK